MLLCASQSGSRLSGVRFTAQSLVNNTTVNTIDDDDENNASLTHLIDLPIYSLFTMAEESTATTKESLLPPWEVPAPAVVSHDMGLYVMNSLTRKKEKFITMDGSKQVRWYMYV